MSKTILITGASQGFGRITADLLHKKGYTVFGTSRNPEKYQTDFTLIPMDVTKPESVKSGVEQVLSKVTGIDVLINNAGRALYGSIEESSEQNIKDLFEINVFGVIRTTAAVLPSMRKKRKGRIINVTSLAGIAPTPTIGIYGATKHAIEGYSKSLMLELEQFGISVVLVKPGEYMTDIFDNSMKSELMIDDYEKFRNLLKEQMAARTPELVKDPQEVGELISSLVDQENPVFDNLIGPYSDVIPELLKTPEELYKVSKEAYQLATLL